MGQGAGMAIEDAAMLVRCMKMMGDDYDVAFRLYKANRIARTSRVQRESHANTWMNYPIDPSWVFAYDALTVPLQPVGSEADTSPNSEASKGAA
jgi:6-hydroxynicotinate 3-monooxygenase